MFNPGDSAGAMELLEILSQPGMLLPAQTEPLTNLPHGQRHVIVIREQIEDGFFVIHNTLVLVIS